MPSFLPTIQSWSLRKFLLTLILIQILLHLPILSLPPMGQHTWRQVMGLSTARNYYEEGHSFLSPAQDVRIGHEDDGVAYFEFPLLYWVIGQSYHLSGFSHVNGRLVMLVVGMIFLVGSYYFIRALGASERRARWFTFFATTSPYFFYYAISVSPNLPALTWYIWSIALFYPSLQKRKWGLRFWLGIGLLVLATLSKATYLFFGLSIGFLFLHEYLKDRNLNVIGVGSIAAFIVLLPNLLIYQHALHLYETIPVERSSYIELDPHFFPETWEQIFQILKPALTKWFLEMFVNSPAIPFFIVGVVVALRRYSWRNPMGGFWILWLVSFLIFASQFFRQFGEHAYYQTPLLLVAALGSAIGVDVMLQHQRWKYIAGVLLICIPLVMVGRVSGRWLDNRQVPIELLENATEISEAIPEGEQVMIIGDSSPLIYLYFLHRKGVTLGRENIPLEEQIKYYHQHHFRWIVSRVPLVDLPSLQPYAQSVFTLGKFEVIRLNETLDAL